MFNAPTLYVFDVCEISDQRHRNVFMMYSQACKKLTYIRVISFAAALGIEASAYPTVGEAKFQNAERVSRRPRHAHAWDKQREQILEVCRQ